MLTLERATSIVQSQGELTARWERERAAGVHRCGLKTRERTTRRLVCRQGETSCSLWQSQSSKQLGAETAWVLFLRVRRHIDGNCPHRQASCSKCQKIGHLGRVCRSQASNFGSMKAQGTGRSRRQRSSIHKVTCDHQEMEVPWDDTDIKWPWIDTVDVNEATTYNQKPIFLSVSLNGRPLQKDLDAGAAVSLISVTIFERLWPQSKPKDWPALQKSEMRLQSYNTEEIFGCGSVEVNVTVAERCYPDKISRLTLPVVEGDGPSLMGCEWLQTLFHNWKAIVQTLTRVNQSELTRSGQKLQMLLKEFDSLFHKEQVSQLILWFANKSGQSFVQQNSVPYVLNLWAGKIRIVSSPVLWRWHFRSYQNQRIIS